MATPNWLELLRELTKNILIRIGLLDALTYSDSKLRSSGFATVPQNQNQSSISYNIPFEVQEEIIKRVYHVKSLIRFRSVSKQWKSLIESPEFITHHTVNQTQSHHLLISYVGDKYVSIVDDDSFPHNKCFLTIPFKLVAPPTILGCSQGLVCLYGCGRYDGGWGGEHIVVWNPSIRKSVSIPVNRGFMALGFGVCPKTYDLKIVKITLYFKVEVFTLSTGVWRSILVNPGLHLESATFNVIFHLNPVVINGVIYWNVRDRNDDLIISFDLISEEFGKIDLPDCLQGCTNQSVYKLKESLALVYKNNVDRFCDVWVMKKNGNSNFSFEKLFTLAYDKSVIYRITGFRTNGQPIILQRFSYKVDDDLTLKVYDPSSQQVNVLEMDGDAFDNSLLSMTFYTNSLLLLNQPATIFK